MFTNKSLISFQVNSDLSKLMFLIRNQSDRLWCSLWLQASKSIRTQFSRIWRLTKFWRQTLNSTQASSNSIRSLWLEDLNQKVNDWLMWLKYKRKYIFYENYCTLYQRNFSHPIILTNSMLQASLYCYKLSDFHTTFTLRIFHFHPPMDLFVIYIKKSLKIGRKRSTK